VSEALENPHKVSLKKPKKVPVETFKEVVKECEK